MRSLLGASVSWVVARRESLDGALDPGEFAFCGDHALAGLGPVVRADGRVAGAFGARQPLALQFESSPQHQRAVGEILIELFHRVLEALLVRFGGFRLIQEHLLVHHLVEFVRADRERGIERRSVRARLPHELECGFGGFQHFRILEHRGDAEPLFPFEAEVGNLGECESASLAAPIAERGGSVGAERKAHAKGAAAGPPCFGHGSLDEVVGEMQRFLAVGGRAAQGHGGALGKAPRESPRCADMQAPIAAFVHPPGQAGGVEIGREHAL